MAEERLQITLEADVAGAQKAIAGFTNSVTKEFQSIPTAIKIAENQLAKFATALKGATDAGQVEFLNRNIATLQTRLDGLRGSAVKAGAGISSIGKGAANANPALVNFGRVIQDAPFGIIGIANNIDPLIESFGRLKQSTGSTGGALKALGGALLGPAGIGIAISAVTSALITFGPQIKAFFSGNKNAAFSAELAAKATKELEEAVASFSNTTATAAAKEITSLNALISGAKNVSLSQKERLFYVDELQKKYPAYLGSLTKEQILAGDTATAYNQLSIDILKAAKARAAQDIVAKLAAQQLQNEFDETKRLSELQKQQIGIKKNIAAETKKDAKAGAFSLNIAGGVQQEELNRKTSEGIALSAEYAAKQKALNKEIAFYTTFVEEGAAATANLGAKLSPSTKATKDKTESVKELTAAERENAAFLAQDLQKKTFDLQLQKESKEAIAARTAALKLENEEKRKAQANSKYGAGLGPATVGPFNPSSLQKGVEAATLIRNELKLTETQAENTSIAMGILGPSVDSVFNALASGENVFEALGNSLKGLVIELVKAVAKALILQAVLALVTGGGSAAAGAAAGAAGGGGFIGKLLGSVFGGRAGGGSVTPGGGYIVGENGPEKFYPSQPGMIVPNGGGGGGNLTARISGNSLLFLLNQASQSSRMNFG
jgi:hypothetical protein